MGAAILTTAALAGGAAIAANAAPAASPTSMVTVSDTTPSTPAHCAAIAKQLAKLYQKLPESLRSDLSGLKGESKDQRHTQLEQVHQNALAGKYGTKIEDYAKKHDGNGMGPLLKLAAAAHQRCSGTNPTTPTPTPAPTAVPGVAVA
jgi:hypothetical protein